MRKPRRVILLLVASLAIAAPAAAAKDSAKKKEDKGAPGSGAKAPPGVTVNACGCYKNEQGGCVCTDRKAKCECPGECEPVGCEEKREKELAREMEAEVKHAQEEDKKRKAAEEAAEKGGGSADGGAAEAEPEPAKPAKPSRKERKEKK